LWADGGGQVAAALKPLHGAMKVVRFLLAIQQKWLPTARAHVIEINGQSSILIRSGSDIHSVMTFEIVEGYIQTIYSVRNPEKLKRLSEFVTGEL
jgi:RNA polymerase sigma-70 factor (ECF subfamily)